MAAAHHGRHHLQAEAASLLPPRPRAHQRATAALNEAVAAPRVAGASWSDIGRATGMTRQSANERWSKRPPTD